MLFVRPLENQCPYFQDIKFEGEYPQLDVNSIWFVMSRLEGAEKNYRLTTCKRGRLGGGFCPASAPFGGGCGQDKKSEVPSFALILVQIVAMD